MPDTLPPRRLRAMVLGRPKSGKTGGIISPLLDAGFEVGVLDFDGNIDPVLSFAKPESLDRLSDVVLQDKLDLGLAPSGRGKEYVQLVSEPRALTNAFAALRDWTKFDPHHPWGPVRTWGTNRVLVVDNLTSMGYASYERIKHINGKVRGTVSDRDWGLAMDDQRFMLSKLMSREYHCHVLVLAHLKMIGPKMERWDKDDDDALIDAKIALSKANAENIPTRLYPSALGRALPQDIMMFTPAVIMADTVDDRRVWRTKPTSDLPVDLGVPGKVEAQLPLETGILKIMEAVTGYSKPPKQEN